MADGPILFIDSGIGGVPYLEAVRRHLPHERLVYVADTAHFPYGDRDADEIRRIVVELAAAALERFAPKLVVVACNTATVVALDALRGRFTVPFVGVVPAVKPAALSAEGGTITVLSTARTADAEYLARLIESFAGNNEVRILAAGDLVSFVEYRLEASTAAERRDAVFKALRGAAELLAHSESVVLGCTHFTHLSREIQDFVGPLVRVIDSREGVARRVSELVSESAAGATRPDAAPAPGAPAGGDEFWVTDELATGAAGRERYRALAARFGLSYNGLHSWTHTH